MTKIDIRDKLDWTESLEVDGVTEIAVLSPVKVGRVPGERRTYEEQLAFQVASFNKRLAEGIPTELSRMTTIHFARITLIRPEHYLTYSDAEPAVAYHTGISASGKIPLPFDPYLERGKASPHRGEFRSFALTQVIFDGNIKVYFREIAEFLEVFANRILGNCDDYPGAGDFDRFWHWIKRYQISGALFYSAYPHLSVPRIRQLEDFRNRFDAFVAKVRGPDGKLVEDMEAQFDEFLRETWQYSSGFPAQGGVYTGMAGHGSAKSEDKR